ncbi:leucyl aminopeptidase [Candidatus Woesearchaeota archaeon]|nr:leucyl aminopeptidase [Candidatus Woesearchaeota archaeon]
MQIFVRTDKLEAFADEALILAYTEEAVEQLKKEKPQDAVGTLVHEVVSTGDFKGNNAQVLVLSSPTVVNAQRLVLLGLGKEKEISAEKIRRAYNAIAKKARELKIKSFGVVFPDSVGGLSDYDLTAGIVEGVVLGAYKFDKYLTEEKEKNGVHHFTILTTSSKAQNVGAFAHQSITVCDNVNYVRDLVTDSTHTINPETLAEEAKRIAKKYGMKCTIYDTKDLKKMGMGLMIAVGQGSKYPPQLIILEYAGNKALKERIALVGKGVTFDSGGLNLKPTNYIETMRGDMAGVGAVLGTMKTLAELKIKRNVVAVLPCVENMIGPEAYKPGDVFKAYNGKTVEISNTDAEGRLILADALAFTVKELKPTAVIDLATLTGSCLVTFGEFVSGLFSNNVEMAKRLFDAGQKTYERVWELPLYEEYKEEMKGEISDLKNIGYKGGKYAGAITAAAFLEKFVGETPWTHLDIAGSAWYESAKYYIPKNGTGFGVRLLTRFFLDL